MKEETVIITESLIHSGMSLRGGWSKRQLKLLGVKWPPESGWKYKVIGKAIPKRAADKFLRLNGKGLRELRAQRKQERIDAGLCRTLAECQLLEASVYLIALERGIRLAANPVESHGKVTTFHWIFTDIATGKRLLEYWPTNGKWYRRSDESKGVEMDVSTVIEMMSKAVAA